MILKAALMALLGLFISSPAWTDEMGPGGDKFYEEAAHFENACQADPCKPPYSKEKVYSQRTNLVKISKIVKDRLHEIAKDQAQIWGDTVLEGDYHVNNRTRLDEVLSFYKDKQVVGYKIIYSQKAWDISNCDFDGSKESLKGCKEGRIIEGSYVSADTFTYFSDEDRYAKFSFNAK